jgi:hypothetical protein
MKILFVAANPDRSRPLSLDEEIRRIQAELAVSSYRDDIQFVPLVAVRPGELIRSLNRNQPDVVHFSGHGTKSGELVLLTEDRRSHPVTPMELANLFGTLISPPKLVVLNACHSFEQVDSIASVVDFVIGFPDEVGDDDAIVFSGQLYGALSEGVTIFNSYKQAIVGTTLVNRTCWENGEPRIMNRPGTKTTVALVPPRAAPPAPQPNPSRRVISDRWVGL